MGRYGHRYNLGALRACIGNCASSVAYWAFTPSRTSTDAGLAPLIPGFDREQHQIYVDHLNAALTTDNVCNIALTGRYGAGKSSVLQEFARHNRKRVLFLSLSTLGPDTDDESRTNQIEKELVKQLLHREKPSRLPQSRYQRIDRLPRWRAVGESVFGLISLGLVLWLFGVLPALPGMASNHPWWLRVTAAVVTSIAAISLVAWTRLAVHNRLVVSAVSAGGASISLTKSESYFDKYLDEIVYFFESARNIDIVIFEDLDRFDEPGIFEALRELNTLLNNSKQTEGRSIRFVYALRDSIFEMLGHDTKCQEGDAAKAEAVRANRTKFFDLVIPVVPFITHRTSRDLLTEILNEGNNTASQATRISPELIDLTARHLPDMRLLTNIRNEYSVYAKRLITDKRGIDGLHPDKLFAMVVYKNVHLSDFEHVLLGSSNLDTIYGLSRDLITESITVRRAQLRDIADAVALERILAERSSEWGGRLAWFVRTIAVLQNPNMPLHGYRIGVNEFAVSAASTDSFWRAVFTEGIGVTAAFSAPGYNTFTVTVTADDIGMLLADSRKDVPRLDDWDGREQDQLARAEVQLRADLETLRTADFCDLAERADFTVTRGDTNVSFERLLAGHINSEVARALIAEGFIDRYYTLYVGQYYGHRVPPNAMNFIVHNIDTNLADHNYHFDNDDEIAAVLRETKRSFLSEVSAYNIGILDYLLKQDDPGAHTILESLIGRGVEQEQSFLQTYLAEGIQTLAAVSYLAERWPDIFTQIVHNANLTRDQKVELVDIALATSNRKIDYQLDQDVRNLMQSTYKSLPILSQPPDTVDTNAGPRQTSDIQVRNAVTTMRRAGFICDDLAALTPRATRVMVESDCYTLTAANLATALGDPDTLSLDRIKAVDDNVYNFALRHSDKYLAAIAAGNGHDGQTDPGTNAIADARPGARNAGATTAARSRTTWTVADPSAFVDIVTDLRRHSKEQIADIISRADPGCMIVDLGAVPDSTWEALAHCQRFPATLANVDRLISHLGELDADLAAVLTTAGAITIPAGDAIADDDDDSSPVSIEATKLRVSEAILNATASIPDPEMRVGLVASLELEEWFPVDRVQPEPGPLLGLLIGERVCADERELFARFDTGDWTTLRYAIERSEKFVDFVTAELLGRNMTLRLLDSNDIGNDVKRAVLNRFDEFIPAGDCDALLAAGRAALTMKHHLAAAEIARIAAGTSNPDLVVRLLHASSGEVGVTDTIQCLMALPDPHNQLEVSEARLTFPKNDHHAAVLKRLQDDGRITMRIYAKTLGKGARIEVRVK